MRSVVLGLDMYVTDEPTCLKTSDRFKIFNRYGGDFFGTEDTNLTQEAYLFSTSAPTCIPNHHDPTVITNPITVSEDDIEIG